MNLKLGGGISDAVYSSVKSFASKGTLLPRSGLETLAEAKNLDDLSVRLKGTVYSDDISQVQRPYSAEKFEIAFRRYLAATHCALMNHTIQPDFLRAYYLKHIAWDLKMILKGKALLMGYDEIVQHMNLYAEELVGRRDVVVKALTAKSLDEAAALLKDGEFGDDIKSAVEFYKGKGEIQLIDTYIDRAYLRSVVSSFNRLNRAYRRSSSDASKVRDMVAVDVDSYNATSLLRAKTWALSRSQARELIVKPTFDISEEDLEGLMSVGSVDEGVKCLAATPYRRIIPAGISDEEIIPRLEAEFELMGYNLARRTFVRQVFGLGVVLGIVKLRELEVRNLSAISFGVEQNIGFNNTMSKLIVMD